MAGLSVLSNNYLRNLYSNNRNLVNVSERAKVSVSDLGKADAKALSKGIASLSSYDYEAETEDETKFYKTLKAFADTYNYTLSSGSDLSQTDNSTKKIVNDIKKLKEEYGDKLEEYGISFDNKGYMSISSTAMDIIKPSKYKEVFGEDSEFLKDLGSLQKKLSRRINYLA